jgi:hypothetical protein
MIHKFEPALVLQMRDIAGAAGEEIIETDDPRALFDQTVAKVRSDESRPARNKRNPFSSTFQS